MVRLAVRDNPRFGVSDMEIRREGPSYTIDTLAELRRLRPDAELFVILGVDALREIDRWRQPRRLFQMATVVGMARPGASLDASVLNAAIPGASERLRLVDSALIDISGTDIRRRVADGASIRYRVPLAVERYIRDHSLYQSQPDAPDCP